MKKSLKNLSLIACAVLLFGGLLFVLGFGITGFKVQALSNVQIEKKYFMESAENTLHSITLDFDVADFNVVFDQTVTSVEIEYPQRQNRKGKNLNRIAVTETQNAIEIKEGKREFSLTIFDFTSPVVTLRLPSSRTYDLKIVTDTGDISLKNNGNFYAFALETDTGDVDFSDSEIFCQGKGTIETDTGDVTLCNLQAGDLEIEIDTGKLHVENVTVADKLLAETDTGDISISQTVKANFLSLQTDTGDIKAKNAVLDGTQVVLSTSTGDISATLTGVKKDYAVTVLTSTGDTNITSNLEDITDATRVLKAETRTGDINIYFTQNP